MGFCARCAVEGATSSLCLNRLGGCYIKDVAKQQNTHYLLWIVDQCKQGLNLSPNLSPTSPTLSSEQLTELIDQRFDSLVSNFLDSLQAQLTTYASRLTHLEAKLKQNPVLPASQPEPTTAIADPTPEKITSHSSKPTQSDKQTLQQKIAQPDKAKQKPDSSPIKLPKTFPPKGLPSVDLAKLLNRHQKTINEHRRRQGNGLLDGWEYKKVEGHAGWRYFPVTTHALKLWKNAIKSGLLNPANAANG